MTEADDVYRERVTRCLESLQDGDEKATDELMAVLHQELRAIARGLVRRGDATLNPTALVNEAYLKLALHERDWDGRRHFLTVAARAMRQALISDHREKQAAKRGGGWQRLTMTGSLLPGPTREVEVLALDEALDRLAEFDPRGAQLVELRFFAGLSMEEVAAVLGVSKTTAEGDWRHARAWLEVELGAEREEP